MSAHRIRLRQPWSTSLVSEDPRQIRYLRTFNKPTGLLPAQVVFLRVQLFVPCDVVLAINGQPCALKRLELPSANDRADVDPRTPRSDISAESDPPAAVVLQARIDERLANLNRIELTVLPRANLDFADGPPPVGQSLVREVAIEIHDPHWFSAEIGQ